MLDKLRPVFFPKNFHEEYKYLGAVPEYGEENEEFKAIWPLVIVMDKLAKPWWCPRVFLRLLHLLSSNNSVVWVRNRFLYDIEKRITKGISLDYYKTKWSDYDLRISVVGPKEVHKLAEMIESNFYRKGRRKDIIEKLKKLNVKEFSKYDSLCKLETLLQKIEKDKRTKNEN